MSLMFSATHPERVSGLVLYGSYATMKDPPWAVSREKFERFLNAVEAHWGEGILIRLNAPSRLEDKAFMKWFGRLERAVASPSSILALMRANYEIDVSDLLPSIDVPTLILHRKGDSLVPVEAGQQLARNIAGAKYVELPGTDHLLQAMDQNVLDMLLDQIEEFVTGQRQSKHVPPAAAGAESGSPEDAIAELERYREILASGDDGRGLAGLVARAEGVVAAARGSWSESETQFLKAAETFRRLGMVWQEARTFQSWGHALLAGANRRAAVEKLDTAIEIYRRNGADQSRIDSVKGDLARANGTNGASRAKTEHPQAPASPEAVFRREGDYWTVSWNGNVVRLKDAKGLNYISYLLANPGRQVLACELAATGTASGDQPASIEPGNTAANLGDAGALIDVKARGQYRRRATELREDLAEAVKLNDPGRAARLRSEIEFLRDQIAAAVGLNGRSRKAASHSERARLMVTKAIKAAIAKVRARDAAIGRYLATSIKTGNYCTYDTDSAPPISWQL